VRKIYYSKEHFEERGELLFFIPKLKPKKKTKKLLIPIKTSPKKWGTQSTQTKRKKPLNIRG
jgi:hypothetical protein